MSVLPLSPVSAFVIIVATSALVAANWTGTGADSFKRQCALEFEAQQAYLVARKAAGAAEKPAEELWDLWRRRTETRMALGALLGLYECPTDMEEANSSKPNDSTEAAGKGLSKQEQQAVAFDQACSEELKAGVLCKRLRDTRFVEGQGSPAAGRLLGAERKWCQTHEKAQKRRQQLGRQANRSICRIPLMDVRRTQANELADKLLAETMAEQPNVGWNPLKDLFRWPRHS